ncbi:hypothetical protein [Chitinophaga rhizophila]|uniref:Acid shock protein n=1 Tax=Chitinophaga rhizophila TaxID=2866212 RepID=A0ABS7GHZ6_9BACT|nr:hypothetical protein [Chitinophaga rhizophila]MBW8686865.1 hypothetical protein [Chitinophaga rhizophila]
MNVKKGLIAAAVLMSISAVTFAQTAKHHTKKANAKTEKTIADSTQSHKTHKPVAKKAA